MRARARSYAEAVEGWVSWTRARRCDGERVGKACARSMAWVARRGSSVGETYGFVMLGRLQSAWIVAGREALWLWYVEAMVVGERYVRWVRKSTSAFACSHLLDDVLDVFGDLSARGAGVEEERRGAVRFLRRLAFGLRGCGEGWAKASMPRGMRWGSPSLEGSSRRKTWLRSSSTVLAKLSRDFLSV